MQCQVCKKAQAKVHYTQIHENQMKKVDLCDACAKENGINDPASFALTEIVLGLGASQKLEEGGGPSGNGGGELTCAHCGFTSADLKKSGRLGCSECYTTFAEPLEALLKNMHKGTQHRGKVPPHARRAIDLEARILQLESELKAAISREDFESAAQFRDAIKMARQQDVPA